MSRRGRPRLYDSVFVRRRRGSGAAGHFDRSFEPDGRRFGSRRASRTRARRGRAVALAIGESEFRSDIDASAASDSGAHFRPVFDPDAPLEPRLRSSWSNPEADFGRPNRIGAHPPRNKRAALDPDPDELFGAALTGGPGEPYSGLGLYGSAQAKMDK